jgi:murein DD-endopeptidase MepM/ murein hydrolase activator NlpD
MGNTGNSFGIHLHFMIFERSVMNGVETEMLKKIKSDMKLDNSPENFNYQFNNLYYDPILFKNWIISLQGGLK